MRWTEEETRFLRRHYRGENRNHLTIEAISCHLGKGYFTVRAQINRQKLRKKRPRWTEKQLEYLADNYGRMPAEEIAKRLKRSTDALKIISFRRLGINQRSNIYSARAVADELGICCSKTIVAWHDRGYLKGKPAPFKHGLHYVWFFDYDDIVECLQERPWLCNLKRMPQTFFKSTVQQEWDKNPWYTKKEAGQFLGLVDGNPIYRYILAGWLPAVRRPRGGGKGQWILRHSDLAEFQLHDPRPAHRKEVTLPLTIEKHLKEAEEKAWKSLARYKFQMFGYWAGVWVHLNSIYKREPNPFAELVQLARKERR